MGLPDAKVALRLDRGGKAIDETLAFDRTKMVIAPRPEALSEVRPGVFYVDLSRYEQKAFDAALPKLVAARAIVFDMRGYPTQDAMNVVAYWITGVDRAQWMIVASATPRSRSPRSSSSPTAARSASPNRSWRTSRRRRPAVSSASAPAG
jgi:hypothetical protein